MEGFGVGSLVFLVFAILGLIALILGIVFLVKNVKWKKQKQLQGVSVTSNVIGIVLFGIMTFFGAVWFICFGLAGIVFAIIGVAA